MSMNFGPEWMRKTNNYETNSNSNQSIINNNHIGGYSKGKTMMNDHSIGSKSNSNKYKYSNEEVLALWNENKNKKIPFDYESNKNIAFTDPLTPVAMIPLNNIEKKILAQSSVNSDITARSSRDNNERQEREIGHYKDRDSRINSRPFSYNRGGVSYDQLQNEKKESSIETSKRGGNIWDNQSSRSSGFINNNNIYPLKDKNEKPGKFKPISNPIDKEINIEAIQDKDLNKLNIKDTSADLSNSLNKMSLKLNYENDKPVLNNSLFGNNIFAPFKSNSLSTPSTVQSFDNPVKTPIEDEKLENSGIIPNIFSEPEPSIENVINDIVIEPPKWNYKDPTGKIQGPFLYDEMQEWYNAGYFEKSLPIKREHDTEFKSLSSMMEQYGEEKPFIVDANNYIKKEKELRLKAAKINANTTPIIPVIKPIQKTTQSTTASLTPEVKVSSPLVTKSMSIPNYSVGGGVGLGRGVGIKENTYNSNLDSVYNSFNNNMMNSPKVYTRNSTFPNITNQFDSIGYPGAGLNNFSNPLTNIPMMGMINNQPWMPSYNDPNLLGLGTNGSWNNMMGMQNQYKGFDSRPYMNPDTSKPNFNQQYINQQMLLQQQTQPMPPQYYQMMRQIPQNQVPSYNVFRQPMYPMGMDQTPLAAQSPTAGSIQNDLIPQINNTKPLMYDNKAIPITSPKNQTPTVWNPNAKPVIPKSFENAGISIQDPSTLENNDEIVNNENNNETQEDQNNNNEFSENVEEKEIENVEKEEEEEVKEEVKEEIEENNEKVMEETKPEEEEPEELQEENEEEEYQDQVEDDLEVKEEEKVNEEVEEEEEKEEIEEVVEEEEKEEKEKTEENISENVESSNEEEEVKNEKEVIKEEVVKAPVKMPWNILVNTQPQRLSLKEIQELEEKEKKEHLKQQKLKIEKEKKEMEESSMTKEESLPGSAHTDTAWGSTPQSAIQKPTLRQIMAEEEINKKKQKDQQIKEAEGKMSSKTTYVAVNTTKSVWGGRPLTIIGNSNSKVITSTLSSAKKETSVSSSTSSTSNSVRATPTTPVITAKVIPSASATSNTSSVRTDNEWTSVGKTTKKSESTSSNTSKINKTSSSSSSDKNKGPSEAFLKWCKNALRVSTSAGVNVDEFVNVLLLIPVNESSIIYDICTDTLGGITAIDPHKFAEEFLRRRKMDQNEQSFTSARSYASSYPYYDDSKNTNKFIPVKGNGRKKNRANLN